MSSVGERDWSSGWEGFFGSRATQVPRSHTHTKKDPKGKKTDKKVQNIFVS